MLSQSLAKKIFGNDDPVNKIIKLDSNDNVKVTGVFKDLPNNTDFRKPLLLPF